MGQLRTAYAQAPLDLDRLATDLAVDVVLAGTLLASKGRVRISAELVAAPVGPSGRVVLVGRVGGPRFRASEVLRLGHLAGIVATVGAAVSGGASPVR